jgi:hypothetical protein
MPGRPQKITFAEMRAASVRGLLVYYVRLSARRSFSKCWKP